jgi:putative ABC transport system permease protein
VLVVVTVMAIGFGQVLVATLSSVKQWCRRSIPADFLLQGSLPDTAFVLATALPDELADEVRSVQGVQHVARIRFVPARVNDTPVLILARTFDRAEPLPLDLRDGQADAVREQLIRGDAVIGVSLARALGLRAGDQLHLETPDGSRALRVAGRATEFAGGGRALYLEWDTARSILHFHGPHILLVTAATGQAQQVSPRLRAFCAERGLLLQTNDDLCRQIDELFSCVTAAFWALIALAFVIASMGVANTLMMNIQEQARELTLLRALGMTSGQMLRLVLWQALLLAGITLLPGTVIGLVLSEVLTHSVDGLALQAGATSVRPLILAVGWAMVLTVTTLSSLPPARRALRISTERSP